MQPHRLPVMCKCSLLRGCAAERTCAERRWRHTHTEPNSALCPADRALPMLCADVQRCVVQAMCSATTASACC